ncbi:MAG: hypothetical protein WC842_03445 [Candidatus Paceibacterota bacterium]|jgi:hypothetical protein
MKKKILFLIIAVLVIGIGLFLTLNKNPFTSSSKTLTVQDVQKIEKEIDGWNADESKKEGGLEDDFKQVGMYNNRPVEVGYVCFGDVCPANGAFFLRYTEKISREECVTIGGKPIIGISWGEVYAGCGLNVLKK